MALIVVNSAAQEDSHKEIMSKLEELEKRIIRLETRICVFMESQGVNPRMIREKPAKKSVSKMDMQLFM